MIWLCVHLPQLPLELFARGMARPLDDASIVLVDEHRVTQRNAVAARMGIEPGCTLATAQSLCHLLVHGRRDPVVERQRLEQLAESAYCFSSLVSLQEPSSILLEVRASLKLFGGLFRLKRRIKRLFTELGHEVQLGVAHTPAAAVALARAGIVPCTEAMPPAELLARSTFAALRNLDIRYSDCDSSQIERLANMGINRLGQLFRLPAAYLAKRFGPELPNYLARLTGRRADPRKSIVPVPTFCTSLHLLEPINDKETLAFPMQRLLAELTGWLVGRTLGVARFCWSFTALQGKPMRVEIELTEPRQSRKNLLAVSRLELERRDLPDEILSIGLEALTLVPWPERNHSLLSASQTRAAEIPPGQLIDQLKARLGPSACKSLEVLDDHRPERAWRQVAPVCRNDWNDRDSPNRSHKASIEAVGRLPVRPLWLLPEPRLIARRQLRLLHGPEHIETAWWDDKSLCGVDRNYYIARLPNGAHCWVFVDPRSAEWYLHGYF